MTPIPFATDDVHGGLSEARGTVCVDGDDLVIEVQVKVLTVFSRDAKTYRFDLTDLVSVRHKRGWTGDKLTLRTRPMDLVTRVPGSAEGALVLSFKRRDRREVDGLLDRLDLWIDE